MFKDSRGKQKLALKFELMLLTFYIGTYMPEFLKNGLAKIRTQSTTWQLKNNIRPKADKKAYIWRRAVS